MNHESKRPVTLEDLLRLKRAERPQAEFWNRFDSELRSKQLAALMEKQRWWNRIPQSLIGLIRYRVAFGAAAVAALTLVTVREYRPAVQPSVAQAAVVAVSASDAIPTSTGVLNVEAVAPMVADAGVLPVYDVRASESTTVVEDVVAAQGTSVAGLSHMVSLLGGVSDPRSSDLIAANLAATQAAEPVVVRSLLGSSRGFETRALPVRATVEPLAQMTHPSDQRRTALLQSTLAMLNSPNLATRPGARAARQISDERFYDQVHRLDASGNQISVKF
jgi:hypothetical protein